MKQRARSSAPTILTIEQWLNKIRSSLLEKEINPVKADIIKLTEHYPLSSFSKQQLNELEKIQEKLELLKINK